MKRFYNTHTTSNCSSFIGPGRLALLMAVLLVLATGCDSGAMDDQEMLTPPVATAQVSITLQEIQVLRDCDSGNNPGDFQFQVAFVDEGNASLADPLDLPQGSTFGVHTGQLTELVTANDNNRINLGQTVSFQRQREDGNGFGLIFSGYEWDSATASDPAMTNRSVTRTHSYQNGSFSNVIGSKEMTLGSGVCMAVLRYTVTVQ